MSHLLDVNVLLAAIWTNHPQHPAADVWVAGKSLAVCPVAELGFLRISTNPKAFGVTMPDARTGLAKFLSETKAARLADDLPALQSHPATSEQVTDHYLAALAEKHGLKLATFDAGIKHAAVDLLSA